MIVRQNRPEDPSLQVPVSIDDPRNALIPFKTRKLCPALILIGDYFSALKFLPLLMVPVWICSGEMSMCYIDSISRRITSPGRRCSLSCRSITPLISSGRNC